jgi:hypothetical protein
MRCLNLAMVAVPLCLLTLLAALPGKADHVIEATEPLLTPEDGMLLGNGDLSASVYQTADRIVFRFGKGDVWDRRIDRTDDPRPAHIDEVARGIRDEGWKCPPYGGPVEATRGTKDPKRMREICQSVPPSYRYRPYPCPKPVGELSLQLPADQTLLRVTQRLHVEEARLEVLCAWRSGVTLRVDCFIPPGTNVLCLRWRVGGWATGTRTGNGVPPVWFSLYRWQDPTIQEFGARFVGQFRHGAFLDMSSPKATPLPRPLVRRVGEMSCVVQPFQPDPTFPQGFDCMMSAFARNVDVETPNTGACGEARLHVMPHADAESGTLVLGVTTTSDGGGAAEAMKALAARIGPDPEPFVERLAKENLASAQRFWSRSSVRIADPLLENLWYETLHARRCTTVAGKFPPGLFLPSTVPDYAHWHGDYHTNYNLQEPFWGDYTANQLEIGDAYFDAMAPILDVGRKIARDYYGARGAFVQLSAYPSKMEDDPLGCVPMGRMAYMTGWCSNQYWWRYLYTLDEGWLRRVGYPALRDCALFYTDFLKKGADGIYHAFPSNQGEDGFSGNPQDYTDRAQIMAHMRYCLRSAIKASEVLKTDEELRAQWRDRLEHSAGDDGKPLPKLTGPDREAYEANPPEFGFGVPYRRAPDAKDRKPWPSPDDGAHTWYFGQYPWGVIGRLRSCSFSPDLDFPVFRSLIETWRHPNGLCWAMSVANYGHAGAWTESLGVIAPLQEMMLQSWDGALRIFPAWPAKLAASFTHLRAEGAFLVSASWADGKVTSLTVTSEKGAVCRIYPPWPGGLRVVDSKGRAVRAHEEVGGRRSFDTKAGETYSVAPTPSSDAPTPGPSPKNRGGGTDR